MLLSEFKLLPAALKRGIMVVLLGATVTAGLTVYTRYKLHLVHELETQIDTLRAEASIARAEGDKFKADAAKLHDKLIKANLKSDKIQAELDRLKVPPRPTELPPTVGQTLTELQNMGLSLVLRPSLTVKPAVAGITAEDAGKVWFWGKEALRSDALEVKLIKSGELIAALEKAKGLAESLAEVRGKEADGYLKTANLYQKEADVQREIVADYKKAITAEQKKKWLYAGGAVLATYLVVKH